MSTAPTLPPLSLPYPWDYAYEWDGPMGARKFTPSERNGRKPDRSVPVFTEEQVRSVATAHASALAQRVNELTTAHAVAVELGATYAARVDELLAEGVAMKADATLDLAGHKFKATDLLRRAVRNIGPGRAGRAGVFWGRVRNCFAIGSTVAVALAEWAGLDPGTGMPLDDAARKGEQQHG